MNEAFSDVMGAAVDARSRPSEDDDHRRRRHLGQEDLLRRRRPQEHVPAGPERRRRASSSRHRADQGRSCAASRPSAAGRRGDQRRRARRRPEIALACHHRIALDAPGSSSACPRSPSACCPAAAASPASSACSASPTALHRGAAPGPATTSRRRRWRRAWSTSSSRPGEELMPAAKAWVLASTPTPRGRSSPGTARATRCPGGTPTHPEARRASCPRFPANLRKQLKGADYPAPRGDPGRRRRGRPGRLRHRAADRGALLHRAGHRADREEHDPGVLLRPPGHQLRLAARPRASSRHGRQGRGPRRRDDGRGHRLLGCALAGSRSSSRTSPPRPPRRARPTPRSCSTRQSPAAG